MIKSNTESVNGLQLSETPALLMLIGIDLIKPPEGKELWESQREKYGILYNTSSLSGKYWMTQQASLLYFYFKSLLLHNG